MTDDGRPFRFQQVDDRKAIVRSDTMDVLGVFSDGYAPHPYGTWLVSNVANLPITLWPGMKIGQLCIFRLSSPA